MLTKRQYLRKIFKRAITRLPPAHGPARAVFVFGEMRSGTNMVINSLDRSWHTECYHESDEEAFDDFVLRDLSVIRGLIKKSKAKNVVFKPIADSSRADEILQAFQGAVGLWIYRRYDDVVNSALRKWVEHRQYLYYMLYEPEKAGWRALNLTDEKRKLIRDYLDAGISDASARALIWYLRNVSYFDQGLATNPNVLLLNYERFVTDPRSQIARICHMLEVPDCSRMRKGIYATSIRKAPPSDIEEEIRRLDDGLFERLEQAYMKDALQATSKSEGRTSHTSF